MLKNFLNLVLSLSHCQLLNQNTVCKCWRLKKTPATQQFEQQDNGPRILAINKEHMTEDRSVMSNEPTGNSNAPTTCLPCVAFSSHVEITGEGSTNQSMPVLF